MLFTVTSCGKTEPVSESRTTKEEPAEKPKDTVERNGIFKTDYEPSEFKQKHIDSDTVQWFCSAYAIYTQHNNKDLGYIGGTSEENLDMYHDAIQTALAEGWSITGRESAIKQIQALMDGGKRKEYQELIQGLKERGLLNLTEEELLSRASGQDADVKQFQAAYRAYQAFGEKAMDGWDYCRALQVLGDCYRAGYISLEECLDQSLETAKLLQSRFSSWEEVCQSYLYGFYYWQEDKIATELRWDEYQELKALTDGPYSIPYDTELKETWKNVKITTEDSESETGKETNENSTSSSNASGIYTLTDAEKNYTAEVKLPKGYEESAGTNENLLCFEKYERENRGLHFIRCWLEPNTAQIDEETSNYISAMNQLEEQQGAKNIRQDELKTQKVEDLTIKYVTVTSEKDGPSRSCYAWAVLDNGAVFDCIIDETTMSENFKFADLGQLLEEIYTGVNQ